MTKVGLGDDMLTEWCWFRGANCGGEEVLDVVVVSRLNVGDLSYIVDVACFSADVNMCTPV